MSSAHWRPNTTPVPNHFFDALMQDLTLAEERVLLYLMRRTYGFQKDHDTDAVSLGQLVDGITRKDGTVLDRGTGLSRPTVIAGIKGLERRGLIDVTRSAQGKGRRSDVSRYALSLALFASNATVPEQGAAGWDKDSLPQVAQGGKEMQPPRGKDSFAGGVKILNPQYTDEQKKVIQKDDHPASARTHGDAPAPAPAPALVDPDPGAGPEAGAVRGAGAGGCAEPDLADAQERRKLARAHGATERQVERLIARLAPLPRQGRSLYRMVRDELFLDQQRRERARSRGG